MQTLKEIKLRLKIYFGEYSAPLCHKLSLIFYPPFKLLEAIDIFSMKAVKAFVPKSRRRFDGDFFDSLAQIPYFTQSLALITLVIVSLLYFSNSTVEESAALITEPSPVETELVMTASLVQEGGFNAPIDDTLPEILRLLIDHYEPPDINSLKELFTRKALIDISRGARESGELSITFDAGETDHAREILEILSKKGIETTFFLTGSFIRKNPKLVIKILKEGHEVGNHTLSHPHLTDFDKTWVHTTLPKVTKEYFLNQINSTAKLFKELTGEDMAPYWRAPYGEINKELTAWALEAGFVHVGWTRDYKNNKTLDTLDWVNEQNSKNYYTAAQIKERILEFDDSAPGLNGGIILMHLGTRRTSEKAVSVLGEIIDEVRLMGFSFVKVSRIARNLLDEPFRGAQERKLALKVKKSREPSL
jgi:peptidoglycan-N-acetylmuramic acid deacetylase